MTRDLRAILQLEVPIVVRLGGRTMSVREVTDLAPGVIIEIPKNADEDLDLLVNNKQIGLGQAVKVGENFGLRVTFIGDMRDRLMAMASQGPSEQAIDADAAALAEQLLAGQI